MRPSSRPDPLQVAISAGDLGLVLQLIAEDSDAFRRAEAALRGPSGDRLRSALGDQAGPHHEDPKALLRRALRRGDRSQVRRNPIARNEGFVCLVCGTTVPPGPGAAVRNHCPYCLRSLHVDGEVPGDRASTCVGVMDPVDWVQQGGGWRATFRCRVCGHERRNRLYPDWAEGPDDLSVLRRPD